MYIYNYMQHHIPGKKQFESLTSAVAQAVFDIQNELAYPISIANQHGVSVMETRSLEDLAYEGKIKLNQPLGGKTNPASSIGLRLLIDSLYSLVDEVESGRLQITGGELIITYHPMDEGGAVSITSDLVLIPAPKGAK